MSLRHSAALADYLVKLGQGGGVWQFL